MPHGRFTNSIVLLFGFHLAGLLLHIAIVSTQALLVSLSLPRALTGSVPQGFVITKPVGWGMILWYFTFMCLYAAADSCVIWKEQWLSSSTACSGD